MHTHTATRRATLATVDETTTLRVRTATRDRVRALGRQRQQSADAVVATALELLEKETFWAAWQAAQASSPEHAEERAEIALWDRASAVDLLTQEHFWPHVQVAGAAMPVRGDRCVSGCR